MNNQYAHVSWRGYTSPDIVQDMIVRYYTIKCDHYPRCIKGRPVLLVRGCPETYAGWATENNGDSEFNERYGWVITLLVPL